MNTKAVGDMSQGAVIAALLKAGQVVLLPFGDNQRYDLVVEQNGEFKRVQVKTGRLKDGSIRFQTCSTYAHRGRGKKDYRGQADLFGIYCPENEKTYLVPVDVVGTTNGRMRIDPPKNGQVAGTRQAVDFEL